MRELRSGKPETFAATLRSLANESRSSSDARAYRIVAYRCIARWDNIDLDSFFFPFRESESIRRAALRKMATFRCNGSARRDESR